MYNRSNGKCVFQLKVFNSLFFAHDILLSRLSSHYICDIKILTISLCLWEVGFLPGPKEGGSDHLQPASCPDKRSPKGSHLPPQSALPGWHTHTRMYILTLFILWITEMIKIKKIYTPYICFWGSGNFGLYTAVTTLEKRIVVLYGCIIVEYYNILQYKVAVVVVWCYVNTIKWHLLLIVTVNKKCVNALVTR